MSKNLRVYTRKNLKGGVFSQIFSNVSVTFFLIGLNVLFFVFALAFGALSSTDCSQTICEYIALRPSSILQGQYLWTFLTSMFMHANFFHLLVNMFVLFSLGSFCEKIIGSKRFFWFYILAGIFAGLITVVFTGLFGGGEIWALIFGDPGMPGVGASGAIFAIAGLFVVLTPKLRFAIIFLPFFSLPAYIMIPVVLFATWLVSIGTGFPIGNMAHFGGFLAGLGYGIYLRKKYSRKVRALNAQIR